MRNKIKADLAEIRSIRKHNNDLWMDILEIACEAAPDKVANLLIGIRANDTAVTNYLTDLVISLVEQQKRGVLEDQ